MHNNNNYQYKICWNKVLTFGVGSIKLSFRTIVFTQYMQDVFNPNVTTFQSNCAEGLHFSAFHLNSIFTLKNKRRKKSHSLASAFFSKMAVNASIVEEGVHSWVALWESTPG